MHLGLSRQNQMANPEPARTIQQVLEQFRADALALSIWADREGTDLSLIGTCDDRPGVRPSLQHDRADDPLGPGGRDTRTGRRLSGPARYDGDEDIAVAVRAEATQRRRVSRIGAEEAPGLVCTHPDLADLCQLAWSGIPNHHKRYANRPLRERSSACGAALMRAGTVHEPGSVT